MLGFFKSKPKVKALLIVDVQNDFIPGGALAVPQGDEVVPVINRLQSEFDLVLATKDWHPAGHCSFASSHRGYKAGDRAELEIGSQLLWPDHCVQGTKGAEFAIGLETKKIQKTFEKGVDRNIDSYSGMYDNGNQRETGLRTHLATKVVNEVHIVGLATDYTVKYTALDCKRAGFEVVVILAGCRAVNLKPGDDAQAIKEMKAAGVQVK